MSDEEKKPLVDSMRSSHYNSTDQSATIVHDTTKNGNKGSKSNGGASSSSGYQGSVVSFHNLFYEVMVGAKCCRKEPKDIIKNVSGLFKPGTMNAIMGPTGSGKSSLLDILAARKDPNGLIGEVLINGHAQPSNFRLMSGYVVQDDVVMGTLSIRENLKFSADLRLPKGHSNADRKEKVDKVLNELSLELCADTRCGDDFTRGVSGGERKRCNVGMELITSPGVLFLDEPTTGLDSSTAFSVMRYLKRLAELGSTIIFSIHQPRYSIFKLCDSLCLLGDGQTIYHGPATEAIDFFGLLGYEIEQHDNPADFFLDVILGNVESTNPEINEENSKLSTSDEEVIVIDAATSAENHAKKCQAISANLAKHFVNSDWGRRLEEELAPYQEGFQGSGEHLPSKEDLSTLSYHTNPFTQFAVVCGRTFKNLIRNPRTSFLQVMTLCFFALITGVIYFQTPNDCKSGVQNRVGAFFFMIMNLIFGNLSGIDLFINERKIFIHENISGFYRISSFFLAKLFCDVLPNRSVPVLGFGVITYWMIGLVPRWENFLFYLLILVMTSWAGSSIAFLASASTRTGAIASLISALFYVFQMIFSGLLVNLDTLGEWIKWAKYISIFSYAMAALQINEFKDTDYYYTPNGTNHSISCVKGNPTAWLDKNNIAYETPWDLWQNIVALTGITAGLMMLTYVQLRRIKKLK